MVFRVWNAPIAHAATGTTTTLAVTSGSGAVTTVAAGSVVTLTAAVKAGSTALTTGQVNFCDASAKYCTDIHLLETAQLTGAGTAVLKFRPGIGSHSYKAVFLGTNAYAGSSSSASALAVTGTTGLLASTTTIAKSGNWGAYTLSASVTESGGTVPPTGTVSFLDTSNGNSVLDTVTLGAGVAGLDWPNPLGMTMPTNSPQAVAVGDFNGDGIPDLAVSAGGPNSPLVILLGNANGTYTTVPGPSIFTYSFGPIVVADFNGDGKQDMAALNANSDTVTILLGNGDGTFNVAPSSPAVGSNAKQIAVGDFNGDGIPDLAVTTGSSSSLNILLGNGDGTFTAATSSPVASSSPFSIVVGDFNGDGKLDLAVSDTYNDTISIFLGNGDGTFAAATTLHSGSNGSPIAAADFTGDGKLDLAVGVAGAAGASDSVTILSGNSDGTFNAASFAQAASAGNISSVQVGDFNADGIPDLELTDSNTGTFTVLLGTGSGSFTATSSSVAAVPNFQLFPAVADLNGDGRTDLVIANFGSDTVLVYLTEPTETAAATANITLTGVGQHLVDASYAGDGDYNSSISGTTPLWGVPPATATALTMTSGGAPVTSVAPGSVVTLTAIVKAGANPVTAGQVNFCDASASECTDTHLLGTVALNSSGTAAFKFVPGAGVHSYKAEFVQDGYGLRSSSSAATLTVGPAPSPVYSDLAAISVSGGFPGDYSLTATVAGYGGTAPPTGNISFLDTSFGNTSLATAPLGTSTAGLGWLLSQTPAAGNPPVSEVTGDFNGDGIPDLALLWTNSSGTGAVTILFGKGDGTFTAGPTTQGSVAGQSYSGMIAGDFNGDGKLDLALLNYSYSISVGSEVSTVTTFLGNGDGTFAVSQPSLVFNQGPGGGDYIQGSMVAADFNGDGKLDLAVVGDYVSQGGVTILLGNGDGTFQAIPTKFEPNQGFNVIATGDFNGDGIPDLVAANYFSPGGATILLGNGDGTFTATATPLAVDTFPSSIVVGDFNGDGKLDLAFGYTGAAEVYLGNGDGTFNQASGSPVNGAGLSLKAGDFNHDGKLDLAGIDNYNDRIDLFLGAGDGTFTVTTTTPVVSQASPGPFAIVAADFNGDGVPDLAMLTSYVDTATILLTEPTETATATVNGLAPVGAGTHNVEASYAGNSNYPSSVSGTVALTAGLAPLVFSPAPGPYSTEQTITISEAIPGAAIYYQGFGIVNTNGYVPYTAPIKLTEGGVETIQAYATETGYDQANYEIVTYTINLPAAPAPVFSPAAGSYPSAQTVTISDSVAGATIYYGTNGDFTSNSPQYTGAVTVSTSETLVAYAIAPGYSASAIASAQYIIDSSPSSFIYTIAGNGNYGYSGDGGTATEADLNGPTGVAVVPAGLANAGDLYIADYANNVVRKVAAGTGIVTTVAGTGIGGYGGDNGQATSAQLLNPSAVAVDSAGNLWILDSGNTRIRKVAAATGTITTANLNGLSPQGFALDGSNNLYVIASDRIWEVSGATNVPIAGTGIYDYSGDNGPATSATLGDPQGIALDGAGNLYIADTENSVIRKVTRSTGIITTVAGDSSYEATSSGNYGFGLSGYTGDGGPATSAQLDLPYSVAFDGAGNLFIADTLNSAIRKVTASTGIITTVTGNGTFCGVAYSGDGGPATSSGLCDPQSIAFDSVGDLYIAETGLARIRKVTVSGPPPTAATAAPVLSVAAGTYVSPQTVTITDATPGAAIYVTLIGSAPAPSAAQLLAGPGYYNGPIDVTGTITIQAIAVAPGYLPSALVTAAYAITSPPVAVISTIAGNGAFGFTGSDGPATSAEFEFPKGIALDGASNLYFADQFDNVVWEVSAATKDIAIVAGKGTAGYTGDNGPATSAELNSPSAVALDSAGNLYVVDSGNEVIRKVAVGTGAITTFAGNGHPGFPGGNGDGGLATSASLNYPAGLVFDSSGNLYIGDSGEGEVRMVAASSGIITTVAGGASGTETPSNNGDGGPATSALLNGPGALAFDSAGDLYIADSYAGRVRMVAAKTGIIKTVAGDGDSGNSGDGGSATAAEVSPEGLAVDAAGNLYLSSQPNSVRKVSATTGVITTVAGNGFLAYTGDGESATVASIAGPWGIAFDAAGDLYIADAGHGRIRKVTFPGPAATPVISLAAGTYTSIQSVAITDGTPGAVIYYTTDGTAPTTASNVYSGPITVSATETLQAIAVATGYTESAVAAEAYTLNLPPGFTINGTAVTVAPGATTANTSTITVTSAGGLTGNVALTAALTASPSGASDLPTFSFGTTTPVSITGVSAGTATLTITTTAATSSALSYPKRPGVPWYAAGGVALACLLLLGIPARRRRWQSMLGLLMLLAALAGGVLSCGGGGGGGGGNPGTTAGTYTITVTGTSGAITQTGKVTLTVQ